MSSESSGSNVTASSAMFCDAFVGTSFMLMVVCRGGLGWLGAKSDGDARVSILKRIMSTQIGQIN